eukprot:gnl/MRDRNA2_/MRDRNA2_101227_c0_seq1.p1 gnl/MRDRNA2_/MRDRNA2_101227_c0~~gnl/MRDRNA2_/MRDRNA2_101227_c0_seq1.p1  ORF type:complete len:147 (+),score=53.35 gnl/MRDRNA2_/MRDRNA2_101227_c0_seq1:97-537(+)
MAAEGQSETKDSKILELEAELARLKSAKEAAEEPAGEPPADWSAAKAKEEKFEAINGFIDLDGKGVPPEPWMIEYRNMVKETYWDTGTSDLMSIDEVTITPFMPGKQPIFVESEEWIEKRGKDKDEESVEVEQPSKEKDEEEIPDE